MSKKEMRANKSIFERNEDQQNEEFFVIVDCTSGGVPYGTTWEEAYEDGLVEPQKTAHVIPDEELPF